jgi:hypothetical protein
MYSEELCLGAFAKLLETTISFVMSVCLSAPRYYVAKRSRVLSTQTNANLSTHELHTYTVPNTALLYSVHRI